MKQKQWLRSGFCLLLALVMLAGMLPAMTLTAKAANTEPGPINSSDVSAKWSLTAPTSYTANTYDFSISQAAEPAFQFTDYLEYGLYNGRTNFPNTGTAVYETLSGGGEKVTLYSTLGKVSADADKQAPVYIRLKAKYDVTITFSLAADTSGTASGFHTYATKFDEKNLPEAYSINPKAGATKKNWGYQYTLSSAANLNAFNGLTNQTVELKAEESMIVGVSYSSARSKNRWVSLTIHNVEGPSFGNFVQLTTQTGDVGQGSVAMAVSDSSVTIDGKYGHQKSATVPNGTQVTATATLGGYYVFDGWYKKGTNELVSKQNPYMFTPTDITDLEARFAEAYNIEFDVESANYGTLEVYSQDGELLLTLPDEKNVAFGRVKVNKTEKVTLKAFPKEDYAFTYYQGEYKVTNANGETTTKYPTLGMGQWWNDNAYTFTPSDLSWLVDGQVNYINALFKFESNVLTYFNPAEGGTYTIGGEEIIADKTSVYTAKDGDWATLAGRQQNMMTWTATPDTYYRFVGWWDASDGKYLTTYDANGNALAQDTATVQRLLTETYKHTIYPVFESEGTVNTQTFQPVTGVSYTVTSRAGIYTISDSPVEVNYLNGESLTVTLGALEEGYEFTGWSNGATGNSITVVGGTAVQPTVKETLIAVTVTGSSYGTYTISKDGAVIKTVAKNAVAETLRVNPTALYTFSFTADSNATFMRWYNGSTELSSSATFQNYLTAGMSIVPDAVPNTYALFQTSKGTFGYLDLAADAAASGDKLITVTRSGAVMHSKGEKNITIPAGVTLLLPHNDHATANGSGGSFPYASVTSVDNSAHPTNPATPGSNVYLKLDVPSGTTINVLGTLSVGGAVAGNGMIVNDDKHSEVYLNQNASIIVGAEGKYTGVLAVCGFVYGPGKVEVLAGNRMYIPFTVNDFRGGGYTVGVAAKISKCNYDIGPYLNHESGEKAIMPFNRYSMEAIQCDQVIRYGAKLLGYADLWAASQHNTCVMYLIGDEETEALIKLMNESSYITIEYNANKKLDGVGRVTLTMYGTVDFGSMTLRLPEYGAEITTSGVYFPIPYNFNIVVNGALNVKNAVKLMPGATVTVNGTMTTNNGLFIYDALHDYGNHGKDVTTDSNKSSVLSEFASEYPGYHVTGPHDPYPTTSQLTSAGLSGSAQLIVNGTLNLHSGTKVAGIIQTNNTSGKINTQSNITTTVTIQEGGIGYWYVLATGSYQYGYSHSGATVRTLNAQVMDAATGQPTNIVAGKTYSASTNSYSLDGFTYDLYYATNWNGSTNTNAKKTVKETVNLPQIGSWYNASVTYDLGEGAAWAAGYTAPTQFAQGAKVTLPTAENVTNGDMIFAGWYDASGNKVTEVTEPITVTAKWLTHMEAQNATCTEDGNLEYWFDGSCYYKNEELTEKFEENGYLVPAVGHQYTLTSVNFSEDGTTYTVTVTCAVCEDLEGHTKTSEPLNSVDSEFTSGDCKTPSTKSYQAVGEFEGVAYDSSTTIEGAIGEHSWQAATCVASKTCSVCGATEGEALSHTYGTVTYTGDGKTEYKAERMCSCGNTQTANATITSEVTKKASCTETGETTYTATFREDWTVDKTTTEEIAKVDHSYGAEWKFNESSHWHECSCGDKSGIADHSYTSEVTKAATCAEAGVETFTCECNHSYTEVIEATGNHSYSWATTTAATCVVKGEETGTCSCGAITTREIAIDSNAHNLVTVAAKAATCTQIGWAEYQYCDREGCTHTTYVEIPATNNHNDSETDKDHICDTCDQVVGACSGGTATCTEQAVCSTCGQAYGGLAEHIPGTAVEEKRVESTCAVAGSYDSVVYCSVCKTHEISRETKALELAEHTYTYVTNGEVQTGTCDCGATDVKIVHTDENESVVTVVPEENEDETDTSVNVTVDIDLLGNIAGQNLGLHLNSDLLELLFDNTALNKILSDHGDKNSVKLEVKNTTPEDTTDKLVFDISLTVDGEKQETSNFGEGKVTVTIPLGSLKLTDKQTVKVWYVNGSQRTLMEEGFNHDRENGKVHFKTNHFSEYEVEVVDETPVGTIVSFVNYTVAAKTPAAISVGGTTISTTTQGASVSETLGSDRAFVVESTQTVVVAYTTDGIDYTPIAISDVANTYVLPEDAIGDIQIVIAFCGDGNLDGALDGKDITLIRRDILTDGTYLSGLKRIAADIKLDSVLDGKDITMIRRYILSNT